LELARQGIVPLAGGTRLLATAIDVPNVMDLGALALNTIEIHDGDLVLGAMGSLQDVIDSPLAYPATAGLLPAACRSQSVSRMIRSMATVGGESVAAAVDSEVAAALLALNTVYVVAQPDGTQEIPALRFLRKPAEDLAGGGLLKALIIPGA